MTDRFLYYVTLLAQLFNTPIHKAAGSLVTGRSLQNGKMSMGNCRTERPPDPILYGGRPSGAFANRAVNCHAIVIIMGLPYCFQWDMIEIALRSNV